MKTATLASTRGGVSRRDSPSGAFVLRGLSVRTRLLGERGTTTRREVERRQRVQRNSGRRQNSPGAYGVRGEGDRDRRPVDREHDADDIIKVTGVVDARNPGRIGRTGVREADHRDNESSEEENTGGVTPPNQSVGPSTGVEDVCPGSRHQQPLTQMRERGQRSHDSNPLSKS